MKKTYTIHLLLALATTLFFCACKNEREEIISTWEDGTPQVVVKLKGKGDKAVKVSETRYYEDGTVQYEKLYAGKDSHPDGIWHYYYPNGKLFAEGKFDQQHKLGENWAIYNTQGAPYAEGDSIRVVEFNEMETPATVCYFQPEGKQLMVQFYSNGSLRSQGLLVNEQREGEWNFFFSNGIPQTEATFVNGKEEGPYTVYRENGVPFYRGQYHEGRRVGVWEVYDEQANLLTTQNY